MCSHAIGWNSMGIGRAHRARARMIDTKLCSTCFLSLMIVYAIGGRREAKLLTALW